MGREIRGVAKKRKTEEPELVVEGGEGGERRDTETEGEELQ